MVQVVVMSLGNNVPKSLIETSSPVLLFAVRLAFGVKRYMQRCWLLLLLMRLFDFVCGRAGCGGGVGVGELWPKCLPC